ncbi:MAG: hypothetical protein KDB74_08060 [Flavobacteriales bacterium]|nr:hypothetical protein [Flavobacteriales bacterium]
MKKLAFILLTISFTIACNQDKIDELSNQNQTLNEVKENQDSVINEMLASFNTIQANLNAIKEREGFISINANNDDFDTNGGANEINKDIELISELMKKNEALIQDLNAKLKSSNIKMAEFRKLIQGLNNQIAEKNLEIAKLNDALEAKNIKINNLYFSIDSLQYSNRQKDSQIQSKIDKINEGYYAYGTFKELKEKNVISKEGGFLGLGKSETLNDDFNKDYFSKIDITKQKSFLIYAKKAELITKHPTSSYEFKSSEGKIDSLVITNAEEFWKASKYMVIVIN